MSVGGAGSAGPGSVGREDPDDVRIPQNVIEYQVMFSHEYKLGAKGEQAYQSILKRLETSLRDPVVSAADTSAILDSLEGLSPRDWVAVVSKLTKGEEETKDKFFAVGTSPMWKFMKTGLGDSREASERFLGQVATKLAPPAGRIEPHMVDSFMEEMKAASKPAGLGGKALGALLFPVALPLSAIFLGRLGKDFVKALSGRG